MIVIGIGIGIGIVVGIVIGIVVGIVIVIVIGSVILILLSLYEYASSMGWTMYIHKMYVHNHVLNQLTN